MISEVHFKTLEHANRELALRFEKLKKARVSRDQRWHQKRRNGILSVVAAPLRRGAGCRRGTDFLIFRNR